MMLRSAPVLVALAAALACLQGAQAQGFVQVAGNGISFSTPGCPDFAPVGWNSWQVIESAGNVCCGGLSGLQSQFDLAAKNNFAVARMFGFVVQQGYNQQITPSADPTKVVYNNSLLVAFDTAIAELGKRNIKAIVALANNWDYNGNMSDCKSWYANKTAGATNPDDFFTNPTTISYYLANAKAIMSRKNSITGIAYNQDPTIMSWDLMNEARCEYTGCTAAGLYAWYAKVAPVVKSYAPNQLITTGIDGFYQSSDCASNVINPVPNSDGWPLRTGQDFLPNHDLQGIDYASIHLWPDNWDRTDLDFGKAWLNNHIVQTQQYLKKPLLLEEFGKAIAPGDSAANQTAYYNVAYSITEYSVDQGNALRGVLFWRWDAVDPTANFTGFDGQATLSSSSQAFTTSILPFAQRIAQRCPANAPHVAAAGSGSATSTAGRKLKQSTTSSAGTTYTVPGPQTATTSSTPSSQTAVATPQSAQAAVPTTGVSSVDVNGQVSGAACQASYAVGSVS